MKYLVSWSGGLDSTYLIYKFLKEGHSVVAAYCEIINNITKTERERYAIEKLKHKLYPLGALEVIDGARVEANGDSLCSFEQVPLLLLSIIYSGGKADKVALAYTLNDDAIAFLSDIKKIYNSYKVLAKDRSWPEMIFPLYRTSKAEILRKLPVELIKDITFCENPSGKDNCGTCTPCRRWKVLEESGAVPEGAKRFKRARHPHSRRIK